MNLLRMIHAEQVKDPLHFNHQRLQMVLRHSLASKLTSGPRALHCKSSIALIRHHFLLFSLLTENSTNLIILTPTCNLPQPPPPPSSYLWPHPLTPPWDSTHLVPPIPTHNPHPIYDLIPSLLFETLPAWSLSPPPLTLTLLSPSSYLWPHPLIPPWDCTHLIPLTPTCNPHPLQPLFLSTTSSPHSSLRLYPLDPSHSHL